MTALAAKGWKIGLRFDPLIHGKNWKKLYQELFETVFVSVHPGISGLASHLFAIML